MKSILRVEHGDVLAALRGFLQHLMEAHIVDSLYVLLEGDGGTIIPALVPDPARLEAANPLAPIMPINGARAVSALTRKKAPARLGAILRPCELRALIELVKLQQATLEGLTLIGMDCPGTYELSDYLGYWRGQNGSSARIPNEALANYLAAAGEGADPTPLAALRLHSGFLPGEALDGLRLRIACQMCVQPIPENVDVHLHLFGYNAKQGIPVTLSDEIADKLEMVESLEGGDGRRAAVERLLARRNQVREKELGEMRAHLAQNGGLADLFTACVRCHNCMTACPICYCKTCLFKTAVFDHPPEHYLNAARRKGALRMLGDTLLFHLTRLIHMSASCVNCGMCTSACQADIPVSTIFSAVGSQVQAAFDYLPGRDVNEPLPLVTFREDEWMEIGEAK